MFIPLKVEQNSRWFFMTTVVWLNISGLDCFAWIDTLLKILFKTSAVHSENLPRRGRVFYNLQAHMQRNQSVHFLSLCVNLFDWGCFCVGESGEHNSKRESGLPYRLIVMVIKEGVLCECWCFRDIAATLVWFYHCREQHWGLPWLLFLRLHFYIFPNTRKEFGLLSFASAVQT